MKGHQLESTSADGHIGTRVCKPKQPADADGLYSDDDEEEKEEEPEIQKKKQNDEVSIF
jgi:hypothetical protein